ncbi:uncharacterized protein LOC130931433 [Corythoichthys intestinalis]|uniref:uncharacterized protein LOC130931433 n=1 Tax=Corythoichthys intestinalis TaxID=161448 RepID=UPI0025A58447|nr:uncharacterized protein LOC130931433 [Corythoichthys intestinalis]
MALSRSLFLCYILCTDIVVPDNPVVELVVTPDYPVAVGQKVSLNCREQSSNYTSNYTFYFQRNEEGIWTEVAEGTNRTLSEPQQSGLYRCFAQRNENRWFSPNHTVYIVSIHPFIAGQDNVGIAALTLSLLALIINITIVFWLCWQRPRDVESAADTESKGFQRSGKDTKGGLPQVENDGQVYMNYSNTNLTYTDLDPTGVNPESTYSVLP